MDGGRREGRNGKRLIKPAIWEGVCEGSLQGNTKVETIFPQKTQSRTVQEGSGRNTGTGNMYWKFLFGSFLNRVSVSCHFCEFCIRNQPVQTCILLAFLLPSNLDLFFKISKSRNPGRMLFMLKPGTL